MSEKQPTKADLMKKMQELMDADTEDANKIEELERGEDSSVESEESEHVETAEEEEVEEEIKKEIEEMPKKDRERLGWGLSTLGFVVEEKKNNFFASVFNNLVSKENEKGNKKGTTARFCKELRDSFVRDSETARKKAEDVKSGKGKHKLSNTGLLLGNVLKYGRIVADVTGASIANPLRYVMMGGMATARLAEAGKEARLANEEVIDQTRITDVDQAYEEAMAMYENAEQESENGEISAEALNDAYLMNMPKDISERLKNPSTANGFIQKILKWDIGNSIDKISYSIKVISENKKLSPKEKKVAEKKLLKKHEKRLKDFDAILTQYGTVDALAMAGRYVEFTGKTVVRAMQVETLIISVEKMWEHLSHALSSFGTGSGTHESITPKTPTINALEKEVVSPMPEPVVTPIQGVGPVNPETLTGTSDTMEIERAKVIEATRKILEEAQPTPPNIIPPPPEPGAETEPEITPTVPPLAEPAPVLVEKAPSIPMAETPASTTYTVLNLDAIVHKNEGIEHALRRQIERSEDFAKNLDYKGEMTDTKALHEFSGRVAHRIALDKGYVDRVTGEEIRIKPADEIAYQLKIENGELKVDELRVKNNILVETHGNEAEFEGEKKENYEYRYGDKNKAEVKDGTADVAEIPELEINPSKSLGQTMEEVTKMREHLLEEDLARAKANVEADYTKTETPTIAETLEQVTSPRGNKYYGGTPKGQYWGGTPIEPTGAVVTSKGEGGANIVYNTNPRGINLNNLTINQAEEILTNNPFHLSREMLEKVDLVYEDSVEKIFPENTLEAWMNVKGKNAYELTDAPEDKVTESYKSLFSYLKKIKQVTGLDPVRKGVLRLRTPETIEKYIERALQFAASKPGLLDKLKL